MSNRRNKKNIVTLAIFLLAVGVIIIVVAITIFANRSGSVSADVTEPPTPPEPSASATVSPPVTPDEPGTQVGDNGWSFPAGWSMINGVFLQGRDQKPFTDAGLILYSFNDPAFPVREWATQAVPAKPLGYYVYNPNGKTTVVNFAAPGTISKAEKIYARGWHLLYWSSDAAAKDDLLSQIILKYANGTQISALQATSATVHSASVKIYLISNESLIDPSSAFKELTGTDSAVTAAKIPAKSYFWLYLRRTHDRDIEILVP